MLSSSEITEWKIVFRIWDSGPEAAQAQRELMNKVRGRKKRG